MACAATSGRAGGRVGITDHQSLGTTDHTTLELIMRLHGPFGITDHTKFGSLMSRSESSKAVENDEPLIPITFRGGSDAVVCERTVPRKILSHTMYLLITFGKSNPPLNRQLSILIGISKE